MNPPAAEHRPSWGPALACALAGAAVFQFFGNATRGYIDSASLFYWWGHQWLNPQSETQHGLLILPLAIGVWWSNVRSTPLADRRSERIWPGVVAMIGALLLHVIGFEGQQTRVSVVALLVFIWGVARLAGGRRWGNAALFPLGFMIFAVPFDALDTGFWLRLWVIKASAGLAHAAGIGVLQSGTLLMAPDGRYQYEVAAACSGVRSLMALLALATLWGYLNFRSGWRRFALFLLCFPLIYVGNVARILSIILVAQWRGQAAGETTHDVMGYGVFVIVLGGLLLATHVLRRWAPEAEQVEERPKPEVEKAGDGNRARKRQWAGAAGVVGLSALIMFNLAHLGSAIERGRAGVRLAADGINPVELPAFLGTDWIGRRTDVTAIEREILPPDTGYSRKEYVAVSNPAERVFMSVVVSGRDRSSIHRPELCLVGQGWTIGESARRQLSVTGDAAGGFPATVLHVQREVRTARGNVVVPELVVYWFIGGDRVVGSHWQRLVVDTWNRVAKGRADRWAYVLMKTDVRDGEAAALGRLQAVLDQTLPALVQPTRIP